MRDDRVIPSVGQWHQWRLVAQEGARRVFECARCGLRAETRGEATELILAAPLRCVGRREPEGGEDR